MQLSYVCRSPNSTMLYANCGRYIHPGYFSLTGFHVQCWMSWNTNSSAITTAQTVAPFEYFNWLEVFGNAGGRQRGFGVPTDLYLWWGDSTVPKSSGSFEIVVLDVQTWWESCKHSGSLLVESLPCWMPWLMFFSCAKMSVDSAVWWREVSICRWLGIGWNFARILPWGCLWSLIYTTIFPRLLRRHVHGQGFYLLRLLCRQVHG